MLPTYLAYFIGSGPGTGPKRPLLAGLRAGMALSAGFAAVFVTAGLLFAVGLRSVAYALPWAAAVIGAVIVIAGACVLVAVVAQRILSTRMGTVHNFPVTAPTPFLSDAVALARARQAMEAEGYSLKLWQPVQKRQANGSAGKSDQFLARDSVDSTSGSITFADSVQSSAHIRVVHIELKQNQIECRISIPR